MHRFLTMLPAMMIVALLSTLPTRAQQVPDLDYSFEITKPAFESGTGPNILIDQFHSPHVKRGSMEPFAKLVVGDGYRVSMLETEITTNSLENTDILLIANAFKRDYRQFSVLEPPSAYSDEEISIIYNWVKDGGKLLWLADHAPFSGGTVKLAAKFGVIFYNSWVVRDKNLPIAFGDIRYHNKFGMNDKHSIFSNPRTNQPLDHVVLYTGQAFIPPDNAEVIFTIPEGYSAIFTNNALLGTADVPRINAAGLSQGATFSVGSGKVALFGETGGFTAQVINGSAKMGMNTSQANHNAAFILATMKWLAN